jgi:hypothetical protein
MNIVVTGKTEDGQPLFEFKMEYTRKGKLTFWPSGYGIKQAIKNFLNKYGDYSI